MLWSGTIKAKKMDDQNKNFYEQWFPIKIKIIIENDVLFKNSNMKRTEDSNDQLFVLISDELPHLHFHTDANQWWYVADQRFQLIHNSHSASSI